MRTPSRLRRWLLVVAIAIGALGSVTAEVGSGPGAAGPQTAALDQRDLALAAAGRSEGAGYDHALGARVATMVDDELPPADRPHDEAAQAGVDLVTAADSGPPPTRRGPPALA